MKTISKVVLVDVPTPSSLGAMFSDLILALTHTLHQMGVSVEYARSLPKTRDPVIVFGGYRFFMKSTVKAQLPDNYFVFNLAPLALGKLDWFDRYIQYIAQHNVIDYSYKNVELLAQTRHRASEAFVFEFGYFDLMPFSGFERADHYLFFDTLNPERVRRLSALKKSGLSIDVVQNTWGFDRDIRIRRARAVINIGKYNPNLLEVYRIWHTLSIGTPVYSDTGNDPRLAQEYAPYVRLTPKLGVESFQEPPISPLLYRQQTDFARSTEALLTFIRERMS